MLHLRRSVFIERRPATHYVKVICLTGDLSMASPSSETDPKRTQVLALYPVRVNASGVKLRALSFDHVDDTNLSSITSTSRKMWYKHNISDCECKAYHRP